jgi:predicted nucleic acid-binding protein
MPQPFLDTNVLLRHLLQDEPDQSPRATAFLKRVEQGEIQVHTSDVVIFETVFTLERRYGGRKAQIRAALLPILELPGILLPGKRKFRKVFALYADLNLPFADAYYAVLMERLHISEIISFDTDFDKLPGITRLEP